MVAQVFVQVPPLHIWPAAQVLPLQGSGWQTEPTQNRPAEHPKAVQSSGTHLSL
jgi:hypothetical protein